MPAIKKRTREEGHLAVDRAIIATEEAFRAVEDTCFRAMFDDENDVLSRIQVVGELLDKVNKSERESALKVLWSRSTKSICLVTDGLTSRRNESIMNYIIVNPYNKPIFWKSFATGYASHDAD